MENKKVQLGVDLGGTDIKFGVVAGERILYKGKRPTPQTSAEDIMDAIAEECLRLKQAYSFESVGIGVPGWYIGEQLYTDNLPFNGTLFVTEMEKRLGMQVFSDNDANCAALGEVMVGNGQDYKDMVLLTLGTGIGSGIIIDGNIVRGKGAAGELGHLIIDAVNGEACTCGQSGCWERYASASALVRQAEKAAQENPESLLAKIYRENQKMNGKLFFEVLSLGCPVAEGVFDAYLDKLVVGILSIRKALDPEIFLLAGGITAVGDVLLKPLQTKLGDAFNIKISVLQDEAGIFGAAYLNPAVR